MLNKLKKVKFTQDDNAIWVGYSDGTTWNGFDNVQVDEQTHLMMLDYWAKFYDYDFETYFEETFGEVPMVDEDGWYRYCYGFCNIIIKEKGTNKMREEEKNQLINGLYSIRECMICELFQLDNETEHELIETGCIGMHTDEMLLCLEEAISIIEKLKKNKLGGI